MLDELTQDDNKGTLEQYTTSAVVKTDPKINHLAGKGLLKCAHFAKMRTFNQNVCILLKMHQNVLKYLIFSEKSHLPSRF